MYNLEKFECRYFLIQKVRNAFQHHGNETQRNMEAFAEHDSLYSEARWNVWCVWHFGLLYEKIFKRNFDN